MPKPGEHKTVQARILAYAKAIGWTFVPREEAEARSGFDAMQPGQALARESPLGVIVDVDDVADVADEHDVLRARVLDDPARVVLEHAVRQRRVARR